MNAKQEVNLYNSYKYENEASGYLNWTSGQRARKSKNFSLFCLKREGNGHCIYLVACVYSQLLNHLTDLHVR
jgi:hypothetical protein